MALVHASAARFGRCGVVLAAWLMEPMLIFLSERCTTEGSGALAGCLHERPVVCVAVGYPGFGLTQVLFMHNSVLYGLVISVWALEDATRDATA